YYITLLTIYISFLHTYSILFFFNAPATTEIYTLSLHDALPISRRQNPHPARRPDGNGHGRHRQRREQRFDSRRGRGRGHSAKGRSEEHTSELQSRGHLVCRLLLEKKKNKKTNI